MTTEQFGVASAPRITTTGRDASTRFLEVRDLKVHFPTDDGLVKSVDGLSFHLDRGKTLGIVGESGSGKSVTSLAIMGLHKRGSVKMSGEIWLDGQELITASPETVRHAARQEDGDDLPGPAVRDAPVLHASGSRSSRRTGSTTTSARRSPASTRSTCWTGSASRSPPSRVDDYPHQFSGGMRQRAMIAMALVNNPELLIADEPTTALDVTVQAQILDLIRDLQDEFGSAVIIITHDLGVVAELADDILVMYAGKAAEYGAGAELFTQPEHPYTWGLLGSMPRMDRGVRDRLLPIQGTPPSLIQVPPGCAFHPRCRYAERDGIPCKTVVPVLAEGDRHGTACHLPPPVRRQLFAEDIAPHL